MRDAYKVWIDQNVNDDNGYGKCDELTRRMVKAFPTLTRRKGFFHSVFWGRRQHWWCRDEGGDIVDPTARQHPDGICFPKSDEAYEDLTDCTDDELAERVPSGKCMDCGAEVYGGKRFCNSACERATLAMMNQEAGIDCEGLL